MSEPEPSTILKYDNLRASAKGLTELEANRIVMFVPAEEVRHLILKFGYTSHRPWLTMGFGLLTVPVGLYGIAETFTNPAGMRYEIGMISLGVIGGSMIFDTLKKRYFLEIHHGKINSRLVLTKKATREGILDFCSKVEAQFNHKIANQLDEGKV